MAAEANVFEKQAAPCSVHATIELCLVQIAGAPPLVSRANLKMNRPMTMTGDRMLPALEIFITLRPDYFGSAASKQ